MTINGGEGRNKVEAIVVSSIYKARETISVKL
jgi:hypothetical protein